MLCLPHVLAARPQISLTLFVLIVALKSQNLHKNVILAVLSVVCRPKPSIVTASRRHVLPPVSRGHTLLHKAAADLL